MREFGRSVQGLAAMPLVELAKSGVRGIILDLDNTLVPAHCEEVPADTHQFLAEACCLGLSAVILSNGSVGRSIRLGGLLGIPAIGAARKPFGLGYRKALEILGMHPEQVVAIGDQFLTDAVGAWNQRIHIVLVDPLSPREALLVRAGRPVDRALRRMLVRHISR